MINTPEKIEQYRLLTLISAAKLEMKGMRMSRGRPATAILRDMGHGGRNRASVIREAQRAYDKRKAELSL